MESVALTHYLPVSDSNAFIDADLPEPTPVGTVMNKVAVIANNVHDRKLMARLLAAHHYRFFDRCESLDTSTDRFQSIILCHRGSGQAPVQMLPNICLCSQIIVFSNRTDESFIVENLNSGASHYFDFRESDRLLKARVDAALRCHGKQKSLVLDVDPYLFKADTGAVYHGERKLDLTAREFALAHYLFSNRTRVVSDSELMTSVWDLPPYSGTRRINTLISIVKKKLKLNTAQSDWKVVRQRTKGYQIRRLSSA